jgi:hypothetical protein
MKKGKEIIELIPIFHNINKVGQDSRSVFILTNALLEILVDILIENKIKNGKKVLQNNIDFSYAAKILLINEVELINDNYYHILECLRKLRNKAAHDPLFDLKKEDLSSLPSEYQDPKTISESCTTIIGGLWNTYKDIFIKYFNI